MSRATSLNIAHNTYVIGDLGFYLYIISTIGMGFIATGYGLFPQYFGPIVITLVLGIIGLVFALASGALQLKVTKIGLTGILFTSIALFFFLGFGAVATLIKAPQAQAGVPLVALPPLIAIMFYSFIGPQEESFWRGLYMTFRKLFPGKRAWLVISLIQGGGGIAFHQFVAFTLFKGTIFSTPGYFVWIGLSWIVYSLILEATKNFGTNAFTHLLWNGAITWLNLMQLGQI